MRRVLLVEDDLLEQELIVEVIEGAGLADVVARSDGNGALDYLRGASPAELPAFVLLDLGLETSNGVEVLQEIRQEAGSRRIPVVILTGSQRETDIYLSYRLGANAYLHKPHDAAEFRRVLESTVKFWLHSNVSPPTLNAPRQ